MYSNTIDNVDLPLNKPNMTKKNGKTFEMTVKLGAKAQIHCPQDDRNKKNSQVMKNV